jgi:hypothetical protein
MTDTRTAWAEVADELSSLALKLKLHAEEELSDEEVAKACGLERLKAVVEETVDAIDDAFDDVAVRENARGLARAFGNAVATTVADVQRRAG